MNNLVANLILLNNLKPVDLQLDYVHHLRQEYPLFYARLVYLMETVAREQAAGTRSTSLPLPQCFQHHHWNAAPVDCSALKVRLSEVQHLRVTNITRLIIDEPLRTTGLPMLDQVRTCFTRHPQLDLLPALPRCQYLAIIDNDEPPGTRVAMVPEPESQAGICAACPCLRSLYIHHAKADLSVHHVRQLIELTVLRGTLRLCPPTPASGEADDDGLELQGLTLGAAAHIPSLASWKLYNLYYLSVESDRHLLQVAECESLPEGMYDEQQASVVASLTVILLPSFRWTRPSRKLRRQEAARFPVGLHRLRLMPGVSTAHLLSLLQFFPSIHTLELVEPEPWLELAVTPYPIHTLILQRPSPTQSTTAWAANLHYEELVVCT